MLLLMALAASSLFGQTLVPGQAVSGTLGEKQSARYTVSLAGGSYVQWKATGRRDIVLTVYRQNGEAVASVNRWAEGVEDVFFVADSDETLTVSVFNRGPGESGFELRAEVRKADDRDRMCASAFRKSYVDRAAAKGTRVEQARANIPVLEAARVEWQRCANPSWEVFTLVQLGQAYASTGEQAKALETIAAAIAMQRGLPEAKNLAINLTTLGVLYSNRGDHKASIAAMEESLRLRRSLDDVRGQGVGLHNLAVMCEQAGDRGRARDLYMQSLAVRRALQDRAGEADTMSNLATFHTSQGEYQLGLEYGAAALRIRTELGNKEGQAVSNTSVGRSYSHLGDLRQAEMYLTRALEFYEQLGNPGTLAMILTDLGAVREKTDGSAEAAIPLYERALELRKKTGVPRFVANAYYALCDGLAQAGQWEKARAAGNDGLRTARQVGFTPSVGNCLYCLGRISFGEGKLDQAVKELTEAVAVLDEAVARDRKAQALALLARVEAARGDLKAGLAAIEEANRVAAETRQSIASANLRASYRGRREWQIDVHTDLLMRLGDTAQAFLVTERWRARGLVEAIAGTPNSLTAEARQKEDALLSAMGTVQRELLRDGLSEAAKAAVRKRLAEAEAELDLFRVGSRRAPAAAELPPVLDEAEVRRQLLGDGEAALMYALGEERSYAWLLTREKLHSAVLPAKKDVAAAVNAYRALLTKPVNALTASAGLRRLDAEGAKLYKLLIGPFDGALAKVNALSVVPDGVLAYLPLEALPGAKRMIERFRIRYAPSLSVVAALRAREKGRVRPEKALLAFADPAYPAGKDASAALVAYRERGVPDSRLPGSRTEVMGIRALYGAGATRLYLGEEAQEPALKREALDSYRYLHFAAHGYLDEQQPARSGILLLPGTGSEDGIVQVEDILRLRLNADLVTLSACQTGVGEVVDGEGVMGLSRAFLQAGAQGVVMSLWNVNDAATAELMRVFHAGLKAGLGRDEALRRAKLGLMRRPGAWRHPYFWGAFVGAGL